MYVIFFSVHKARNNNAYVIKGLIYECLCLIANMLSISIVFFVIVIIKLLKFKLSLIERRNSSIFCIYCRRQPIKKHLRIVLRYKNQPKIHKRQKNLAIFIKFFAFLDLLLQEMTEYKKRLGKGPTNIVGIPQQVVPAQLKEEDDDDEEDDD